jgi:hypothetical protein
MTDILARDGSPGLLRRLSAGSTAIAVSAGSAVAGMVLPAGVIHPAVVAVGALVGITVALVGASAGVVDRWSKVLSERRRRRAVDRLIEHVTVELQTSEFTRRQEQHLAELQALFNLRGG